MVQGFRLDWVRPRELGSAERGLWAEFAAAMPFRSPYFSHAYAAAADEVVPGACVAVLHRGGSILGFLPLQRRGTKLQPLGAPMTDYHGVIGSGGGELSLTEVVRLSGHQSFSFNALVGSAPVGGTVSSKTRMAADLGEGLDAYLQARPSARRFIKQKERMGRRLEHKYGPLVFSGDDPDGDAFRFVVERKRQQYRESAQHDIFACGWTERFLRRLWEERGASFGARVATLRAGDRLLAAQLDLWGEGVHHVWFPAYDPAYAEFGPGVQLMHAILRAAAADPEIAVMDFGVEGLAYKRIYATPGSAVLDGEVQASGAPALLRSVSMRSHLLERTHERLRRRFYVIDACETRPDRWLGGAAYAFRAASFRRAAAEPVAAEA